MKPEEALKWLESREPWGMRLRLDVMHRALEALGNPQEALKVVHVGGTNGKGSVVALVASALRSAGLKVGAYTSPHLVRFEERIAVNGAPISAAALAAEVARVAPLVEALEPETGPFTYFEVATLVAFLHFRAERVDVAVLEVGLGGRLDATNVVKDPLVSVVTNVDLEHTQVLGDTIEAIAREKGAIVKPGVPFVTAAKGAALDVLLAIANENVAPVKVVGRDLRAIRVRTNGFAGQRIRFEGLARDPGEVELPFSGDHQLENAGIAAAVLEALDREHVPIPVRAIVEGFARARWPGRLEYVAGRPALLLDGAHNPAGAHALARFLEEEKLRPVALFGALSDKNWMEMIEALAPQLSAVVATEPPSERRLEAMFPAREFARAGVVATVVQDVGYALRTAKAQAGPDGIVLVCGSLYLVGDVLRRLEKPR